MIDHAKTNVGDVLYLCDRRACETCHSNCEHTNDISHAVNFELVDSIYVEKERPLVNTDKVTYTILRQRKRRKSNDS